MLEHHIFEKIVIKYSTVWFSNEQIIVFHNWCILFQHHLGYICKNPLIIPNPDLKHWSLFQQWFQMFCWNINIICCMQHNNLKVNHFMSSVKHFWNNYLLLWRSISFLFDGSLSLASNFFWYAAVSRSSFHSWINLVWSI